MNAYLGHVGAVLLLFPIFALAASNLAVGLLHVEYERLPRWQRHPKVRLFLRHVDHSHGRPRSPTAVDYVFATIGLLLPVYVWLPGNYLDLGVRLIWGASMLASISWLLVLLMLPKDQDRI